MNLGISGICNSRLPGPHFGPARRRLEFKDFSARQMSGVAHIRLFLEALQSEETLRARGFTAVRDPRNGIIIQRGGHFRGLWTNCSDEFVWIPAGYSQPTKVSSSISEAVDYTLAEILKF